MIAIVAIALNDMRLRLRRWITGVVVLVVVVLTWQVIQDPAKGIALIAIDNARVIYDSQTIAIGSVTFASLFFSLFAVYLVRGQSVNEIQNGVGVLLATTAVSTPKFILGRWLGAMLYLTSLIFIFILTLFVLHAVRGEAALEPLTYFTIILGTLLPLCAFAASMALFCDAIPALQGRAGDVLYFLLWLAQMSLLSQMESIMKVHPHLLALDGNGMVTVISQFEALTPHKSLSIGGGSFDPNIAPLTLKTMLWTTQMTWYRAQAFAVMTVPLLFAMLFFHRYDPARLRQTSGQQKTSWWRRLNSLLRPIARYSGSLLPHTAALPNTMRIMINELLLTVIQNPILPLLLIVSWFLQSMSSITQMDGAMAIAIACAGVLSADIAARHQHAVCDKMRSAVVAIHEWSVWQQFSIVLFIFSAFLLPSLLRFGMLFSVRSIALPITIVVVSAAATLLALITRSGKAFTVILLFTLYVCLNTSASPIMDMAGMRGAIDSAALINHGLIAISLIVLLECWRRWQLKTA